MHFKRIKQLIISLLFLSINSYLWSATPSAPSQTYKQTWALTDKKDKEEKETSDATTDEKEIVEEKRGKEKKEVKETKETDETTRMGEATTSSLEPHEFVHDTAPGLNAIVCVYAFRILQALTDPHVLNGHTSIVFSGAWNPDGTHLASGSSDNTVRIWNRETGNVQILNGHTGVVYSVAWSPDGTHLASGSWDGTVRILNRETGEVQILNGHTDVVFSAAWSPDGNHLASCSRDRTVRIWNRQTGKVQILNGHTGSVTSVAWSPDGNHLASCSWDRTMRIWNRETGTAVQILNGHTGVVFSVAWSPDGTHLASCSSDRTVRIWDVAAGNAVQTLNGHTDTVCSVVWNRDGTHLASGSVDNTVRIWNVADGTAQILNGHTDIVYSVAWNPDGTHLASGSADRTVRIWPIIYVSIAREQDIRERLRNYNIHQTIAKMNPYIEAMDKICDESALVLAMINIPQQDNSSMVDNSIIKLELLLTQATIEYNTIKKLTGDSQYPSIKSLRNQAQEIAHKIESHLEQAREFKLKLIQLKKIKSLKAIVPMPVNSAIICTHPSLITRTRSLPKSYLDKGHTSLITPQATISAPIPSTGTGAISTAAGEILSLAARRRALRKSFVLTPPTSTIISAPSPSSSVGTGAAPVSTISAQGTSNVENKNIKE